MPLALIAVGLAFVLNYVGAAAGLTAFDGPGERSLVLAVAFAVAVLIQVAALVWWMLLGHVNGFRTRRSPQAPSLHQLAGPYGG